MPHWDVRGFKVDNPKGSTALRKNAKADRLLVRFQQPKTTMVGGGFAFRSDARPCSLPIDPIQPFGRGAGPLSSWIWKQPSSHRRIFEGSQREGAYAFVVDFGANGSSDSTFGAALVSAFSVAFVFVFPCPLFFSPPLKILPQRRFAYGDSALN